MLSRGRWRRPSVGHVRPVPIAGWSVISRFWMMSPPSRCAAREAPDHPILPRNTPPPLQDRTLHSQARRLRHVGFGYLGFQPVAVDQVFVDSIEAHGMLSFVSTSRSRVL
jgi:hypothetical protein